jgi:hypothetical protein
MMCKMSSTAAHPARILAFSAASIFRLAFFIIVCVYHDGSRPAANNSREPRARRRSRPEVDPDFGTRLAPGEIETDMIQPE